MTGVTWAPNQKITTAKMRINCTTCGGGGTPRYQGDYDAITAIDNQSLMVWTDFRAGTFGSYVGFFPDFAMLVSPTVDSVASDQDSVFYDINVPSVKLYDKDAIFSAIVTPIPSSGDIDIGFPNGNTLSSFPGTLQMRVKTSGNVPVGDYTITISGNGPNGTPVHKRTVALYVGLAIPVELTAFNASVNKNDVVLNWTTATELNNLGFEIQRKSVEGEFESIGFVNGKVTTTGVNNYSFADSKVDAGTYLYRLMQKDFDGTFAYSQEVEVEISLPLEYSLEQNYPNPFNPVTTIKYSIPNVISIPNSRERNLNVTLKVYDVGNEIATLVKEEKRAGTYNVQFTMNNLQLSSGVYFYKLQAGSFVQTKKMVLMK